MQKKKKNDEFKKETAQAENCLNENKLDEARVHLEKALELNPEYAEGYCNLGLILLNNGEFSEAEKYFQISLLKDDNMVEAYFNLGCSFQERNDYEKALSFFKEVILREPDNALTYLKMGFCAQPLERIDDARVFFEEALRLQPDSLEAGAALSGLHVENEDYEKAEEVLRINLVSHPDEVPLHYALGLILKEQQKYESALAQFHEVVTLDENHPEGFYHLADCCGQLGFLKQAEPFFAKAYKLDETFSEAVFQLGNVYEGMKKMDTAVIMYRRWIDMVESNLWQLGEDMTETYKEKCKIIADYLEKNGSDEKEIDCYREKCELSGCDENDHIDIGTDTAESDYRVSLQIDD